MMKKEMKMTDMNLLLSFILTEATDEQLMKLNRAALDRRATLARNARRTLQVGQAIKFIHHGIYYSGVLKQIKIKKATITIDGNSKLGPVNYTVPLSMLEAA